MTDKQLIGFIGQGFIGKHLADDFEERGHTIVRYALEEPYVQNRESIGRCEIVFIAVPTPTTPTGFSYTAVDRALSLLGSGTIAVIKSTILPGTTLRLQTKFPELIILHSPEFLREKFAALDTKEPLRTILGLPVDSEEHQIAAQRVLGMLPQSPYVLICTASEAELIKYAGNCFLAAKVIFMNIIYDAATAIGANYDIIAEAMKADPRIGTSHMNVVDQSGHEGSIPGRGAGGHCFPKDLAALRTWYARTHASDRTGIEMLTALEHKNNDLLRQSKKDLDLLTDIYGQEVV